MALFGNLATVRAQLIRRTVYDLSFAYLDDALKSGTMANKRVHSIGLGETNRVELGEGAFALEQSYNSKARADGRLESHLQYIDIQVIVAGEETIEVAEISTLKVKENLTPAKDLIFYEDAHATTPIRLSGLGATAIFYPRDGHMGGLAIAAPMQIRKIVIKVPVAKAAWTAPAGI
ncbi:MAG TPA: YhcH/YjgK/YiaL family protein [Opitutales bacterium]|jgi:biofilm protein TabA|nr:YhcH/YjgK/YiaL family protein [Opitutales bacterium]